MLDVNVGHSYVDLSMRNMERQALQAAEDAKIPCISRLLFTRPSHFFRVPHQD